ncbi:MAG: hypothetical protein LBS00_11120 [Synergistaceae bacterium]|jgi:hypothetical protein|nr:hypothetical protein [Synergistaceae bacterium]
MKRSMLLLVGVLMLSLGTSAVAYADVEGVTKAGYPIAATRGILDEAMGYISNGDNSALQELMNRGVLVVSEAGVSVYISDISTFSGICSIRPRGSTTKLWTVIECVERK